MDLSFRRMRPEEFERFASVIEAAFSSLATPEAIENERRVAELDRMVVSTDGDEIVGGAGVYSLRLSVPGGDVACGGVTSVGVLPTHRRRGANTGMMRMVLQDVRERGEPIAALHASQGAIYGRFGFGLATLRAEIDLEARASAFVRGYGPAGSVRLAERADALDAIVAVSAASRAARPGAPETDPRWVEYRLGDHHDPADRVEPFFLVHRTDGIDDAYAWYRVRQEWPDGIPSYKLEVHDLQAITPQAYAEIWRAVLDVDLVARVTSWNRPVDEPLLHLLAEPRALRLGVRDGLWLRLLDIPAALDARAYTADGEVVIEVDDRFCPWNDGRYRLEVSGGRGSCTRTDTDPNLAASVNVLGAAYLGGTTFRQSARGLQVRELRPGALAEVDAMFAWDPAPWCPFMF